MAKTNNSANVPLLTKKNTHNLTENVMIESAESTQISCFL